MIHPMPETTPATPAQAATPGSNEQGTVPAAAATTPSVTTPGQGTTPAGQVTISTAEFAQLSRDAARGRSKGRRPTQGPTSQVDPDDPAAQAIAQANSERDSANQRALRLEVREEVRGILDKPEFAKLSRSTRELILKNPAALSEADNLEDALSDIETFIAEQVAVEDAYARGDTSTTVPAVTVPGVSQVKEPTGHETPVLPGGGAPAPAPANELEDLTRLTGAARTQAAIRNAIRGKRA